MELEEMGSFFNERVDGYEQHMLNNVAGSNKYYIETDYMAPNQEYEDQCFAENKKIRSKLGITEGFYHYDTPCTVENEIKMLLKAGFKSIKNIGKYGNTGILLAKK